MAHLWIVLYTKSISYVRGFTSEIYHFFSIGKGLVRHIGIRQFHPTKIYVFCHSTFPDLSLFRFRNVYPTDMPFFFLVFFFFIFYFFLPFFFFFLFAFLGGRRIFCFLVKHTLNSSCNHSNVIRRINGNNIDITYIIYCV